MRKIATAVLCAAFVLLPSAAARADHLTPDRYPRQSMPLSTPLLKEGDIRHIANATGGRGVAAPFGESGTFTRDGRRYLLASSMLYGLHVLDVTDPLAPVQIADYAAAFGCPNQLAEYIAARGGDATSPNAAFDLAYNTALGSISGWENDLAVTPDGKIAVLGMDAPGRCHDPMKGGLELIDLTDLRNPRTLHLTRNVGEAHSVTIDPVRPWLAYLSTSDGNDFIDIVDFKSCLGGVANIDACRPVVARAVFSHAHMAGLPEDPAAPQDPARDGVGDGCHDIRFRGNRGYCAAIDTTLILDTSKVLGPDGTLTGTHLTSGPDACVIRDAVRAPGVKVTDCGGWTESAFATRKATAVTMRALSVIDHDGSKPPTQDISIAHQAEPIEGGKILMITDERGGGLGAGPGYDFGCHQGRCVRRADNGCPGGGIWFYDIRDEANPRLMKQPDGSDALFLTKDFVQTYASCTVHYGQQFGDERILTFAWYTAGTHVIRFTPDYAANPATIAFEEIAAYIPVAGWTIQAFPMTRNPADPDELIVYSADASRGVDVFGVRVPKQGAAGVTPPAQVLGVRSSRTLAATGVGDWLAAATVLLAAAALIARRARRLRWPL